MDSESKIRITLRVLMVVLLVYTFSNASAQQTPFDPLSYWVFIPYVYNPAMAGSKDFLSIGLNASFQGNSNAQIFSGNTRNSKTKSGYFNSPDIIEFKNTGIGGSIFKDVNGQFRNIGLSAAGSYQIPLSTRNLSFLSFGVSLKGVYNKTDYSSTDPNSSIETTFYPNIDLGIYFFGPNLYAGLSSVNLHEIKGKPDSTGVSTNLVTRQYFFTAGYKILLSKSLDIVLEPSIVYFTGDTATTKSSNKINPIIKLYMGEYCIGTAFQRNGAISIFSQFRYPRFFIGAFYEFAKNTPYFKKSPVVEVTLGLNLQSDKSRFSNKSRW
jgi:type IX secretion system PorP/SprF family membrane protein